MSTQAVNACIFFLIYKKSFTIQAVRATVQNEWNVAATKAHTYQFTTCMLLKLPHVPPRNHALKSQTQPSVT